MRIMSKPLITVIVAVYCAEKYIKRCLDSIIAQDYENWNAILVNDASKDNSLEIIKEYAKKDTRFIVINNEENIGVAPTRNKALEKADGEYIAFLDSDDWWDTDMLSSLLEIAEKNDSDVVQCKYRYDYENGQWYEPADIFPDETVFEGEEIKKIYKLMMSGMRMNHVCMKLYKREVLRGKLFDVKMKTGEDLVFNIDVFSDVRKYTYIKKPMYHYYRVTDGLTSSSLGFKEKWKNNKYISNIMKQKLPFIDMDTPYYRFMVWIRPYRLVISKMYRMLMDKLHMGKTGEN